MSISEEIKDLTYISSEQVHQGICWLDGSGQIYHVNRTLCQRLGYTREEMLKKNAADFSPFTPAWFEQNAAEFRDGIGIFESTQTTKSGQVIPVELTVQYVTFEGRRLACSASFDMTDRKRREDELQEALDELAALKNQLEAENIYLREEIKLEHNFSEIVCRGTVCKKMLKRIEQVAPTDTSVLILGETGTGKELIARAVHSLSSRKDRPLVKVNCAALPTNLVESELFGHEKGAFTGALTQKVGRFELADQGTIFLDEIGDLPIELQAKLLRVLQEGEFERLGGTKTLKVDVRVIAATNRDLENAMANGTFREDLYYRLNVFPITSPPLRERKEDIPLLVQHFIRKYSPQIGKKIEVVPQKVMEILQSYNWPGNIRGLENAIVRSMIITTGKELQFEDCFRREHVVSKESSELKSFEEMERGYILKILDQTGWRIRGASGAAEILKLNPTTLESKMKKLGIERKKVAAEGAHK